MNELDGLARRVVDAVFQVHKILGPGLMESVYETCLCHELRLRGIPFRSQVDLPIRYRDLELEGGFRIDILVDGTIILELKAVEKLLPIHEAQLLTYLKLSGLKLGFLVNFNVPLIKDGLKRRIL
jgi:GxxExxY protein